MIIGISTDTVNVQQKFADKEKLTFPLYSDSELKIAKTFGVVIPGKNMAKRATFVINKEGNVAKIFPAVGNAGDHPREVLEYVKKLAEKK